MTEESPPPPTPTKRRRQAWDWFGGLHDRPVLKTLVSLVGIVGGLAGVAVLVLMMVRPDGQEGSATPDGSTELSVNTQASVSADASPESPEASAAQTPSSTLAPSPGECWSESGEAVACAWPHTVELVPIDAADCTASALVRHMGGDPELDVTWVAVDVQDVGESQACVASSAREWSGSLAGVFTTSSADALRVCEDAQFASELVGCDEPHTLEAVGPATADRAAADCEAAASTYTGVPADRLDTRLQILVRETADGLARCAIAVTGGDVLTASLRSIGSQAVPLASR